MYEHLPSLIRFLEEKDLMDINKLENDQESFLTRFKIQKYVFLSKYFGLKFPYGYSMYIHGPYSSSLADDYFELSKNKTDLYDHVSSNLPETFKATEFLTFVANKNESWLEIATTLLSRNKVIYTKDELIYNVSNIKEGYSNEYISDVLTELTKNELITIHQ